ncbi:hypothetical protein [Agrobacterium sp. SORGH_AS 787]|uniref:hypothetical protein n=1 Tax=Agrobacterium sp. SORGH_AS 787 TaxID=3041775 RepID=UPI0027816375|nr:hypothetical protein [Rhizobium sp. SORGH_AS_0787]
MADARLPNMPCFAEIFCCLAKQEKLGPKIAFYLGLVKIKSGVKRKILLRERCDIITFLQELPRFQAGKCGLKG